MPFVRIPDLAHKTTV